MVDDAVIAEAGRRLSEAAPQARVILFGSHARGEAGQRSDVDFLVIEPEVENEAAESVRLCKALRGLLIPAEVVVVSEDRVNEWRDVSGSLVHAALAEGIDLAS
jgi:predicted nucleotidyltransferase